MGVLNALLVDFILRLFAGDDVDGGWGWSSYSVVVIILVISPLFCHKKRRRNDPICSRTHIHSPFT